MRQIIRRITGWILVLSMITSMFGQPIPMAYAADGNEVMGEKPELSFTMTYYSGGSSINQNKHTTDGEQGDLSENLRNKNSALLGRGVENGITVDLTADLKNGRGTARGMYFELQLPVFRVEGSKLIELDQSEIEQLKDEDFKKENSKLVRVMAQFSPEDADLWDGYVSGTSYWGSSVKIYRTGELTGGTQAVVKTKLYFDGHMPENTAALVRLGGGYAECEDNDKIYYDWFETAATTTDTKAIFTMICCNLEWEPTIEGVKPKNVIWDRYNYVTYKVTVKNTSKDQDSNYSATSIQMVVPTNMGTVDGWSSGLHPEEAAKFLYNDGNPIKNDDFESSIQRENYMVGVPGKGGIMIYDVTALEATAEGQEAMSKWDMTHFTNIKDENGKKLEEIPYYFKPDGGIYFRKYEKIYNEVGAKIHDDGSEYDHTTFYVALPMATDIPSSKLDSLNIKVYNTIAFANDYTWTKTTNHNTWGFIKPEDSFTHKKFVVDKTIVNGEEVEEEKDKLFVAINDEADYYLGHFKNTGNIPIFNGMANDTHDKDFGLTKISALFNLAEGEKEPELTDWFKKDDTVEFEFLTYDDLAGSGGPVSEFVSLGQLEPDETLSNDKQKAWSLQIGNLIKDYEQSVIATGKKCVYNNRFRVRFKKRIDPGEEFDGRITVHGVAGKGKVYNNKLDTTYEKWIWNPTSMAEDDTGYVKTPKKLATDEADIQAIVAKPQINAQVIEKTENGYQYDDPKTVPVNVPGYGFYYQLGNDSVSRIVPGMFSTGTVATVNDTTKAVKGFITDKVILSKRLVDEIAEIENITLHTSADTDKDIVLAVSDFSKDDDGNYYIDRSKWENKGEILSVSVNVKKFEKEINLTEDNKDVYVVLEGTANTVTPNGNAANAIKPVGTFETKYKDEDLNVKATDPATMIVANINPVIRGISYGRKWLKDSDYIESKENRASGAADQSTIHQIEVPKGIDNSGYKFFIGNATPSPAGKSEISVDLSGSVGNKTTKDVNVRGFLTKTVTISGFKNVADIKQIRLYNWDKDSSKDNADVTIPFKELEVKDGAVTIKLEDYSQIEYLKYMVIDMDEFYGGGVKDTPEMEIQLNGDTNWVDYLDAKLTFTPEDESIRGQGNTKGTVSLTDRLYVQRPYADIHADLHYYEFDGTTKTSNDNRDGNDKYLGLPYDRDFTYTIDVGNPYISKLDDFDITIDVPVNDNKQGEEANTGFHTTGFRISKELIEQYEKLETITFFDADSNAGKTFVIDYEEGRLISKDDDTIIEGIVLNGDIYIDEQKIFTEFGMNIPNLKKIIITGKGFQANPDAPADKKHRITLYGFSDSAIHSWNKMDVNGTNYLCGFRGEKSEYVLNSHDTAQAYISKMYFDTTIVAGYKDNKDNGKRFDEVSDSYEHVRAEDWHSGYGWSNHWPDDDELDIGYKAIGSYMIDFRQYLNAGTNHPSDAHHHSLNDMEVYGYPTYRCYPYDYIYTQSMNTAADVQMTVDLPSDSFDAYYMKVHPKAYKYLESVKIHRSGDDNDTWTTVTDWKDSVEKITGSTEKDSYYRVDLRKLDDDYGIYKSPLIDYEVDKPVDKITITLNINRDASEEKDGQIVAKNADYGTWYEQTKYMFEVTGRFYKAGMADATASTKMDIGNLIERPYAKAKRRTDQGRANGWNDIGSAYRSSWSYQDYYDPCGSSWHDYSNYKSSHLFSTAKVYVYPAVNNVQKGVHTKAAQETDERAKFSKYNEYVVSFWQAEEGSTHDCYNAHTGMGHAGGHSLNNDPYNWSGKRSFTDQLTLTDTLPYVRPDKETGHFGFLTKKIFISEDLKQYIDKIVVYKKKAVLNEDGTCNEQNLADTIEIAGADLIKEDVNAERPEQIQGSDQHVVHSNADKTFYEIPIIYPDSEIEETKGAIVLGENEYVTKYEIHMKNMPGDVDYAAELKGREGLFDSYDHGSSTDPDIYVGGDVYRVTADNIINSGEKCDWNNMQSASYMQKSDAPYYTYNDKALITSYRIPFQGGYTITRNHSGDTIYDYEKDNKTPTTAKFDVRVWNRKDLDDEENRSAEIDSAAVTNTMNENYRLKNIYIPTEFIEGTWFNVEYLQLDDTKIEIEALRESKYFKKNADGTQYIFDVNGYIRDNLDKMNTFAPNNTKIGSSEYYHEQISKFVVKFKGIGKEILDGGEFLNPSRESLSDITIEKASPTFSYDGVYVDRHKEDIENDSWTFDSKPTIINNANHYTSTTHNENHVGVKFTTNESDAWPYGYRTDTGTGNDASGTKKTDYYIVNNLVSTMVVDMKRQSTLKSGDSTFAYDIDGNKELAVDKKHLLPDDYVEYQITVGADADSLIPLYHPDVRFKAPKGQRIVGWYVLDNDSEIPKEDITAKAILGDGNTVTFEQKKRYCKDSQNAVTNYKWLDISCGDLSKSDAYNQLNNGEKVKIVVVTQLTHEINPFEGKVINDDEKERIYVYGHPKHTYSQYRILHKNGQTDNRASGDFYIDNAEEATYYRGNGNGYYGSFYDKESTYYADIRTKLRFFDNRLDLTLKYVDDYDLPGKDEDTNPHIDERPMIIELRGADKSDVYNDTLHTLSSATYTVSFLSDNRKDGRLFKGFDLVEKPVFKYPEKLNPDGNRNAAVKYCFFDDIGTDKGIYTDGEYAEVWLSEDKVIEGDKLTQQQKNDGCRLLKDAVKIQWTYDDIPAEPIVFATSEKPFEFRGIGRYRDIRNDAEKQTKTADDNFTIGITAVSELVHSHSENINNTIEDGTSEDIIYEGTAKVVGNGSITNVITRERPIVTLHTQIFNSVDVAGEEYDENAAQVKGYRPGDTVWYKSTVINHEKGQTQPQGALLEPVIFDKIPEYITTSGLDTNNIKVKWYDADGKLKEDIPNYTITRERFEDVADYGGDFVTEKSNTDGCYQGRGHAFADLTFGESGNSTSTPINYNVYAIQFEKGSRLEIGERLEVYYEAEIREENLPLAYTKRTGTDSVTKTFVDYYPKMGEYYQWTHGYYTGYSWDGNNYSYPYANAVNGLSIQFKNQNDMMDMNYLYHDVGVSGTRNKNIDRYEYLKDSDAFMPGSGADGNSYGRTEIYGSNGYLKDEDIRTANNQQRTYYVPTRTDGKHDELPLSESYRSQSISGNARDWYSRLMSLRVRSANWQGEHSDAVLWAESRLHLQTAWLAASSEMIGDENYLKSKEYLPTNYRDGKWDNHYNSDYWYSGCTNLRDYTREINDDTITTLEYDQYFTSRIGAYNYGDWDITGGIEFTYIMPQGIEPKLNKDGTPDFSDITAEIMREGTSANPVYEKIDASDVTVEVVQKPGSADGYLTPNIMRDPLLSTSVMNKTGDSYEGKNAYYTAEEHTSWVLKITVKKTLGKWFNRGDKSGYAMRVDIPSHVYATPKDEYWYDEVMVKPVDTEENLYYQVYDTTTLWGNNYLVGMPTPISTQKNGMDFMWNVYYVHTHSGSEQCIDGSKYFWNGSPNTPYINGMNITNREVSTQGVTEDSVPTDNRQAFSNGVRNTYANTGTRAHMRKPMIRTWTTIGEDNVAGNKAADYYVDPQGDSSAVNIHVENKYWLNTLAPDHMWYDYYSTHYRETFKVRHTYATDGGNMGTLFYPVITEILPAGIVPKDVNGDLFTHNNEENAKKKLDWTLKGADYNGGSLEELKEYQDEKELYQCTVEYIELAGEDGKVEGRYRINFKQKAEPDVRSDKKIKIDSESARVFSFKFFTEDGSDIATKDGKEDRRLGDQYQSNHTFVSSELDYFKFLIDSDAVNAARENPYFVGGPFVSTYVHGGWAGTIPDTRRDSAETSIKAMLPKVPTANNMGTDSAINATDEGGVKRYIEDGKKIKIDGRELDMEDYPNLRESLHLKAEDSDLDGGYDTSNMGVHTSSRIRLKYPVIENKTFVSKNVAEAVDNLGGRSPQWQNGIYDYYPSQNIPVEYLNDLYFNVKVVNGADSVGTEDYYHHGNMSHGKMKVTIVLPSIVRTVSLKGSDVYLLFKKADGETVRMNIDEAEDLGFEFKVLNHFINDEQKETIIFEVRTPGDYADDITAANYDDYIRGKHMPGYFGYKDTLVVGVKTTVRNNILDTEKIDFTDDYWKDPVWDEEFKADGYVTMDDVNGDYLKTMNADGDFDLLTELDGAGITYEKMVSDDKETNTDWDGDKDYTDEYTKDESAIVTLMKPHSTVRLDTSVQRSEIDNPDLVEGVQRVVDDPIIKSAVKLSVYMDQAVNEGGAVGEFIVDWRIPFRSTLLGTTEEAPVTEDTITKRIYALGTGVWEIPDTAGDEAYRERLKNDLDVQVYALCSKDAENAADSASYKNINNMWEGEWINLTELYNKHVNRIERPGVDIDKNTVIDISDLSLKLYGERSELGQKIYQVRYVVSSKTGNYAVPKGFRLAIDADPEKDGNQEMNEIDPEHENVEPLPESVTSEPDENGEYSEDAKIGNAAFIMLTGSHLSATRRHVNHFATGWARYDDTQYCVDSMRSRAGYYIARELPVIEIDMNNQYFKIGKNQEGKSEYKWSDDIVINDASHMLKYKLQLKNLSNKEIEKTNVGEVEEDTATNPQLVAVLPIIQNIDMSLESKDPLIYKKYHEVEYGEEEWESTLSPDCTANVSFKDSQAAWTWHVEDGKGNVVPKDKHDITSVTMAMYDKIAGIKYLRQRRIMRWTSKGHLAPGQRIVIEFMVPVSTEDTFTTTTELLSCKAYGFKPGAFVPHIPTSEEAVNYAYEIDVRDVNDNGESNVENTITVSVNNIGFSGTNAFNRTKRSFSEYGTGQNEQGNGRDRPSLVPEGTNYDFISSIINPDTQGTSKGFQQPVIYDVLPFVGDTQLVAQTSGYAASRGTDWRGWLNLASIEVKTQTGSEARTLKDGNDVHVWVGPFNYSGSKIVKIPIEKLPDVSQTSSIAFYNQIRGESGAAINEKCKYFVRLSDLLRLKTTNKEEYSELEKHAQAIYVEPLNNYFLASNTKLSVSYRLKAPLNMPLSKKYTPEDSENILNATADVDGWNSFSAQSGSDKAVESPYAGVYTAAPADRGYIGHYVWLDESYNAKFTDEGEYIQRDGRWLLNKATKDLDYDGEIDDPGINDVKVELLTEKGYPVNRLGEAVVEKDGRYLVINENSGKISVDSMGSPIYTPYGPMAYTTEKDAYGHDGYFIISNIKPGKYNLRYTFPEGSKYEKYALTTRSLGVTGTSIKVYRPGEDDVLPDLGAAGKGDEPSDGAKVKSFTIQTTEPIQIDAIGEDESTYAEYDEKMTSYDLGVAPSFSYGGYAWMDIQYDAEGQPKSDSINGQMDDAEQKLENVGIHIYEVKADGTHVPAYDKNGLEIKMLYTDENGYFKTTLYPYRSYIAVADAKKVNDVIQPSPVTISTRALQYEKDNDLLYNEELNQNTTNVFAIIPTSADYNMGTCVDGQYGTYNRLGFGYVPAGIGAIGKYVFNDENYDGIRNEYIDKDGYIVSEPGIDNVKLVLEKYYYKDGKWNLLNDHFAETTSLGSSYSFIVDASYTDETADEEGTKYLCGYKVKVDMSTVPEGFVPTKYYMNDGVSDSDLPIRGDNYRYLTKEPVIIASVADKNSLDEYKITMEDETYDISKALIITKYDAGFTTEDRAQIDGVVWNDKNYDGERGKYTDAEGNKTDEPGMADVELQLVPYVYYNNKWEHLDKDNLKNADKYNEYTPITITDADGVYSFTGVRTVAVMSDDTKCIVGYKIRVNTDIEDLHYGITKYRTCDTDVDSDLWKTENGEFILNAEDEFIITAKKIPAKDVEKEYGKEALKNQEELLIHNNLGYFEINKVTDYKGNDAGLVEFRQGSVSGKVWLDDDYNGIMDDSEHGMAEEKVTIRRYYLESVSDGKGKWTEDTTYTGPVCTTDVQGDYLFDNLDSYIYKDGKYYLAGYKVYMAEEPDNSVYGITLYGQYNPDIQRGSDLKELELTKDDDYIIIAKHCGKVDDSENINGISAAEKVGELAHVAAYKGNYYDLVTARAYEKLDAGYHLYPNATITGCAFEDYNYDGIMNSGKDGKVDSFTDELKAALNGNDIVVKATAYYYDHGQWKQHIDNAGTPVIYTDVISASSTDGRYEIAVPTKINVEHKNYLAGYKLEVNMIPKGYHITKHKADGKVSDSNALIKEASAKYNITKTLAKRPYAGTIKEEMDGYVIPANPSDDPSSANIIGDYDIAEGRVVSDYNMGYVAHETSMIDGIAFEDKNDNGKYDKPAEGDGKTSDKLLSGVKVGIKRYQFDAENNTWVKAPKADAPNDEYFAVAVTDKDGYYAFENLPTHVDTGDKADKPVLYGYTVWLLEMPVNDEGQEMAATYYQANKDKNDSALVAGNMQIIKAESNPNLDADELKDGNTMIAHKLPEIDPERSDIVEGYDCTVGSPRDGYNLGFVDYAKGSIEGCVFHDKNIDGIIDKDDAKYENISVGLKRFVFENGQWTLAQDEGTEYFATAVTEADGNYKFDNLATFTTDDGTKRIYGYEVWVMETPEDHVITRYQMNHGKNDSAVLLDSQIIKKDTTLSEVLDGKLVVARKTNTAKEDGLDDIYVVEGYDVVRETHLNDYNAGYTILRKGEINGTVFEDADYDGIMDEDEKLWEGIEVGLKRFVYEDGKWVPAQDEEFIKTTVTDGDGHYTFGNLKTHVKKDGENKLYGYEVWVLKDKDGYAVTRYGNDSFLLISGQIIKADTELPEMLDGKTVVAHKVTEQDNVEGINDVYFVEGYNVILAEIVGDYNAGYIKEQKGSISGTVFDDVNYDGIIGEEDKFMKDIEVGLKQFVYEEGKWIPTQEEGFISTTVTDEKGHYIFENLETHKKEENVNKLYGYEVWITKDPDGYAVTRYGDDSFLLISGQVIKADTELPEMLDGKTVVAHKVTEQDSIEGIDEIYFAEGYNVVLAEDIEKYNAGYMKEQKGSISGTVFDDVNYDGIISEEDKFMKGIEVGLKQFVYEEGKWIPTQGEGFIITTVTDEKGHYTFDNLETHKKEDNVNKLYGYEVWIMKDPDGYAVTRYGNDSFLLISGQVIKADTELSEMLDGKTVVAHKVTEQDSIEGIDEIYFAEGYNVVLAEDIEKYNAGYMKEQRGSISGTVFDDINYDGIIGEEDKFMKDFEVGLKQFVYEDGEWIPTHDEKFISTTVTDEKGHYVFNNLETHKKEENVNKLYGYEVWVVKDEEGYAVTRYGEDSFLLVNGQVIKLDMELSEMFAGKSVTAHKVTEQENVEGIDEIYFVEGYNVVLAENPDRYNAGYMKEQKGSISGTVFDDINYDGKIDEEDKFVKDFEVGLKQFVYEDGEWIPTHEEGFISTTVTDENGHYTFDNLETHKKEKDANQLYGYDVWIIKDPDGYAVTRYGDSSFLLVSGQIIKADTELPEMLDGKIVVAHKVTEQDNVKGIDEIYFAEGYNVVLAENLEDYNAGYTIIEKAAITGSVFDDVNYDGLIDNEDNMLENIEIGLKRFVYKDGEWKPAPDKKAEDQNEVNNTESDKNQNKEETSTTETDAEQKTEEFFATTLTDKGGNYAFENLDTFVTEDGNNYMYGYELYIINHEDRLATKYQMNEGTGDSALRSDNYQIIKKDNGREELFKGCIVLAQKKDKEENPNKPYVIEGYDVVKAIVRDQNNAGFVAKHNHSISGLVWIDEDHDGICNEETFAKGVDITLEKLYLQNGQWLTMDSEAFVTVQTGKDGTYRFDNLELYGYKDEKPVVYGYRVKVPNLPSRYGVTIFHTDGEGNKNDLNEKTGYLENEQVLIVLADKADETTPSDYNIEGYNISHGFSVESLDAGIVPYGVGSIAGIVFEDANADGIIDDNEEIFEDKEVYLEYKDGSDEESDFVRYPGGKTVTDERGLFIFENLPVLDENNEPYQYRVTMEKPEERSFTKAFDFVIFGDKKVNILSPDTEKGDKDEVTTGITPVITLAVPRKQKNCYNLKYEFDGYNHKNAYLGFTQVEKADQIQTGLDDRYWWALLPIMLAIMTGAIVVIVGNKKRRKEIE